VGTYSDFPDSPANFGNTHDAKEWAQWFTASASFGGETCPAGGAERWRSCDNMRPDDSEIPEPAKLHMNYLNSEYAPDAEETWMNGGCYDYIQRNLGYRFKVTRVEYTPTVASGQNFSVTIDILNSGWARLHKPRRARLVLRNESTPPQSYDLLAGETETWAPETTTRLSASEPAPITPGTYSVRLAIPDPDVPDDAPTYIPNAVRLASLRDGVNVFDGNTGDNNLGVSITVQ
jgi:hypothetical protein